MNTRTILSLGLSALVFGGAMVGCTITGGSGLASASVRSDAIDAKAAAKNDAAARKALAQRDLDAAIRFGEAAVALAPRDADYRMTLAQSYLQAGRFASARQAFADVLALTPDNGKAALNLSLAQTATGDQATARETLGAHRNSIPAADLGLALALAGDSQGAVTLLMQTAREPGTNAKLRQNLALALALSGNWNGARIAASADMAPGAVDARMQEWAAFAQPAHASDQVAWLLGVTPTQDAGQPVALALAASVPMTAAAGIAESSPVSSPIASAPTSWSTPTPVAIAPAWAAAKTHVTAISPLVAAAVPVTFASPALKHVIFGPSSEVVQMLPPPLIRADTTPTKVAVAVAIAITAPRRAAPVAGDWYVQLGAYDNAGVARDGWNRAKRRFASFAALQPRGMTFASGAGRFYRLSIGGFGRADAVRMCSGYRARGGACFVRRDGGDQMAQWLGKRIEVASR